MTASFVIRLEQDGPAVYVAISSTRHVTLTGELSEATHFNSRAEADKTLVQVHWVNPKAFVVLQTTGLDGQPRLGFAG